MKILFAYGNYISHETAQTITKRNGYDIDAVYYPDLLAAKDLADRLASYEVAVVEVAPPRPKTETQKKCLQSRGYKEGEIYDLIKVMQAVANHMPIIAIAKYDDDLTKLTNMNIRTTGMLNKDKYQKRMLWQTIRSVIADNFAKKELLAESSGAPVRSKRTSLSYNGSNGMLSSKRTSVYLPPAERQMLQLLLNNQTVSKKTFYQVFCENTGVEPKIVEVYLSKMRKKIGALFPGKNPKDFPIETAWGIGYKWVGPQPKITSLYVPNEGVAGAMKKAIGEIANGHAAELAMASPEQPAQINAKPHDPSFDLG